MTPIYGQSDNMVSHYLPFTDNGRPGSEALSSEPQPKNLKWQLATDHMKNDQFFSDENRIYMRSGEDSFQLLTIDEEESVKGLDEMDSVDVVLENLSEQVSLNSSMNEAERDSVDHRTWQSPIRNQGNRSTCGVFSLVGALEALGSGVPEDLSEEDGYHLAAKYIGKSPESNTGIWPHELAEALKTNWLCKENNWPYNPSKSSIPRERPRAASENGVCGVKAFMKFKIDDEFKKSGLQKVENLLALGQDICATFKVAWDNRVTRRTGVIDMYCDENGLPLKSKAAHAMLIVGYERESRYFIVKNSYGQSYGKDGYVYLSYDYFSQYAYGSWLCVSRTQVVSKVNNVDQGSMVSSVGGLLDSDGAVNLPSLNLLGQ